MGVSLFAACLDSDTKVRSKALKIALQSWLFLNVDEIVIIDWNARLDIPEFTIDKKVKIIRLHEAPTRWKVGQALNIAASVCVGDIFLKVDVDYIFTPYAPFTDIHLLTPGSFFCGDQPVVRIQNERALCGLLYCYKDDFWKVNGYHEKMYGYGEEDIDLYQRLIRLNLEKKDINFDSVHHLYHDNIHRITFTPYRGKENYEIARSEPWTMRDQRQKVDIKWNGNVADAEFVRKQFI